MKLKFFITCLLAIIFSDGALAKDAGLRYIINNGAVKCGTDLSSSTYAYKNEDGFWKGIDVDLCKSISLAIFGRSDAYKMVNVRSEDIDRALDTERIDIMLGGTSYSASEDIKSKATPVDILYYDQQMFLAKKVDAANSMEAYKGAKVCTVAHSEDLGNLQEYSEKYKLDLGDLQYGTPNKAREAFLLNRCTLITGNAIYLKSIQAKNFAKNDDVIILPESIAIKPIYAYVASDNKTLQVIVKWIINALKLAEEKDITSKNVDVFIGTKEASTQNLLGDNPKLWEKFGLKPKWVRQALAEIGNYGEIYEKNLGSQSSILVERNENNLMKNKGLIIPRPFL